MKKYKFKDLEDSDIEYLKLMYHADNYKHEEKMEILSKKYGVIGRTIRRWWKEELKLSRKYTKLPLALEKAQEYELNTNTDIIFYTAAQNKTAVNRGMLEGMELYKDFLTEKGYNVQIVIAPTRYRNPTSPHEDLSSEEWWVDEVSKYLCYNNLDFCDTKLYCKTKIRPTAVNPLSGLELMASNKSAIFPHSKIHLKSLPRLRGQKLRVMSTTGYITVKNYSDSKAGEKAFEHHSYGFVVIEKSKDGECYMPRNVKVNSDGSFTDVIYEVKDGEVNEIESCQGIVLGDIHGVKVDKEFLSQTNKIISKISPKYTVLHDLFDGDSVNPHEEKDLFIKKQKIKENRLNIGLEIEKTLDILDEIVKHSNNVKVIESNHDIFLDRHINNFNWKNDLHNSHFYLGLAHVQQTVDLRPYGNIFGYLVSEVQGVDYVKYGDSLMIGEYEAGLHGDFGTNGSRGNINQFSRLNIKMIHAHTHSPAIMGGVTCVGITCEKDQYYTRKGLSSWAKAHSVIHNTGKNQLWIFNDNNKFTNLC